VRSFYLCPFHWKTRQSAVNLELPGPENIPQSPRNQAEVGQIYHARRAVSATLSVLKWSGAIFRSRSSKVSVQKNLLSQINWKPRPSWVSLELPGLKNIPEVPETRAEVGQNHDAPKVVSATLSVLKWRGAIFLLRISKVCLQKNWLCPFHCKPRPSAITLQSLGLEYIPEVSGNLAQVGQNHDARKTVSATLSVLKWSGAIFRPTSSKVNVQKVWLSAFHCKPRPSGISLEYAEVENIP